MTRLWAWTLALVVALAWPAGPAAAAGQPVVRVTIEPKGPVLVGQQVRVDVQVLVPNYFMSGLTFPAIDVPGAVVARPDQSAQHLNEVIGGESYAGLQESFTVTPQRAGEFTLPPARITFRYAAEPGKATEAAVTLPPQRFTAKLPPGAAVPPGAGPGAAAAAGSPAAPVARVTVTQTLDRDLKNVKVGDALTRTVTAFAERTQTMMIPPPTFAAPPGVRVYRQDPVLTDERGDRGEFVGGRRTDRVTYVFEQPGDYTLPAVEIAWFNPATGKPEVARAPALAVAVAANPGTSPAIAPEPPPVEAAPPPSARLDWRRWGPWTAGVVAGAVLLAWLAFRYVPRYRARRAARRRASEESEPAWFRRAERACRGDDPAAAYRALGDWARSAGAGSLTAWCAAAGAAGLRGQLAALEETLFAGRPPATPWDGRRFAAALTAARGAWLSSRNHVSGRAPALPALNP